VTRFPKTMALVAAMALLAPQVLAQDYPTGNVTIVVGSSPGGSTDAVARIIADGLSTKWGVPVVVENREGAMNTIAASHVANAKPDGSVLLMASPQHTQAPAQMDLNFDAVADFAPITMVDKYPTYLVINSGVPAETTAEFIEYARANPGQLNFGSAGRGSGQFRNMSMLMEETGIELAEITYSGGSPTNVALMGNEVQATFSTLSGVQGMDESQVRVLAVTTATPSPFLPDVPTLQESAGLESFDEFDWHGLFAPAGTPDAVVDKIQADVATLMAEANTRAMMDQLGVELVLDSPADFNAFVAADVERWTAFFADAAQ
jgi:tripartite-type tricarboxylate transporter receptor subunit TctC